MAENNGTWQSNKPNSKLDLKKLFRNHSGPPISSTSRKITNKLVSETFWPDSLDKESNKAARILFGFCKHGMYQDEVRDNSNHTTQKPKMWSRIPEDVISRAKGIVIFTIMRTGLWISGAGGSGVVVARTATGSWSWPIAIELHTAELGFLIGVDIYDCVLVLNTTEAVESFSKSRCVIGGDLYATPGPLGVGWFFDKDARARQSPIFSYLRSRGYYAAVQLDHAVVVERAEENKKFYRLPNLSPKDIFTGNHIHRPASCLALLETLKATEGATDVDETRLPIGPPPSDFEVVEEGHAFGVPDKEDPDPYGVLALEKQGLLIREAGTKTSPTMDTFEFNPSIKSPIYAKYNRRSADTLSVRSSWRRSVMSGGDRYDQSSIRSRETDQDSLPPASPALTPSFRTIQLSDIDTNSTPGTQNSTNGDQVVSGESEVRRENSVTTKVQKGNGRQQTIYEDETEADQVDSTQLEPRVLPAAMDNNAADESQSQSNGLETLDIKESKPTTRLDRDVDGTKKLDREPLTIETNRLENISSEIENSDHESDLDGPESSIEIHDAIFQGGAPSSVYQAVTSITLPKARIVNVSKPFPPLLPPRNPGRVGGPSSENLALDELSQVESSADQDLTDHETDMHDEEYYESKMSSPSTPPLKTTKEQLSETPSPADSNSKFSNEPVSPVDSLKQRTSRLYRSEVDPQPSNDENNKPEAKTTTLMDIHKGLNASPSPEASSPEDTRGYFT